MARGDLVRALRCASGGVAAFVQERVHSTSIGLESTSAFVQELLQELESALKELIPDESAAEANALDELEHEQEVELGTLVSASSLSIRYVTERDAMTPLLDRFQAVFSTILHLPCWGRSYLGLKTVALMGSTRVLEAFGEHIKTEDVEQELTWLAARWPLDAPTTSPLVVSYLFRPTCEYISVALQTHPACEKHVFAQILPELLSLVVVWRDEDASADVPGPVKAELASTIAVLLDMKLAAPTNAFALLPMPSFVEETQTSQSEGVFTTETEKDGSRTLQDLDQQSLSQSCETFSAWLSVDPVRTAAALVLPLLCQTISSLSSDSTSASAIVSSIESMSVCVQNLEPKTFEDFEFANNAVEMLRDITLRIPALSEISIRSILDALPSVMPHLEAAIKSPGIEKSKLKSIKSTCSTIRQTLVEAWLAWIHNSGANYFSQFYDEFLSLPTSVVGADPRIYGDALFVALRGANQSSGIQDQIEQSIATVSRALNQLHRYSKNAANHIVGAVIRLAVACDEKITPFADDLAYPLVASIVDESVKGKSLHLRVEAVGCVLLGCTKDSSFQLDEHAWVQQFIELLVAPDSLENVQYLTVLKGLTDNSPRLLDLVARICLQHPESIGHVVHTSLARWPLFEEDLETTAVLLEILMALLSVESVREALDADHLRKTVASLAENASRDGLDAIAAACSRALALDCLQ